ncbi:ABC transporter substrate-binding protein [Alkalimonas delamerensis]|uniref:ABC transporter substrate-binding protein n=1 Tax=Alkalimonas delamerensis TaxID=265981 RepID=A0ABT9GSK7_9GAMM|nr:ABC transporter substrate-binding protein [Alkalimonas delamerensis]MDP4529952.1 ABC transporter substrate-binding protein [Alkalimonas delamerensis]
MLKLSLKNAPLISLLCWLGTGCQPEMPAEVRSGLVYCSEGAPETFNPQLVTSGTTIDATSRQLFDRLLDIDPISGDFVPALATHWEVREDGLSYTFYLRPGVQFHTTDYFRPSRPLRASDVRFSFERIMQIEHPFHRIGGGDYPYFQTVDWGNRVSRIATPAEDQVVFYLRQRDSSFLSNLATDFAVIHSAEYAEQLLQQHQPQRLDSHPIGTGPFRFREYRKDGFIRYYRHNDYWGTPSQLEQLVIDIEPNNAKRMARLLTHECDIIAYPRMSELELISQRPDIKVQQQSSLNVGFWAFNTSRPPFNDARVRRALAMAINRDAILQSVYFEQAQNASTLLPPRSWGHHPEIALPSYDPDAARQLLSEAGFPYGFAMTIWAMPVQRLYNPNATRMAEMMQADLARIGVRATIVSLEWNAFRRQLRLGEHDSVLLGWNADNTDPDNFFRPLLSCNGVESGTNRAMWCDPAFDALLGQALLTDDRSIRRSYYWAAQEYLAEHLPLLPLAHGKRFQAINARVGGITMNPYGGIDLSGAFLRQPEGAP